MKKNSVLYRRQISEKLEVLRHFRDKMPIYTGRWIEVIRQALGMTQAQLARRLGIQPQSLHNLEKNELSQSISVGSLKKVANALHCQIYIAFIPEKAIEKIVQEKALQIATKIIMDTAHTMDLEKQAPTERFLKKQIKEVAEELIKNADKRIWENH